MVRNSTWLAAVMFVALAIIHQFFVRLDVMTIGLLVIAALPFVIQHVKSFTLPGGLSIELKDVQQPVAQVKAVELRTHEAKIGVRAYVASPAEAEAIDETRKAIARLRSVLVTDPNLALVGFGIELEARLRSLAERSGIGEKRALGALVRDLGRLGILPEGLIPGILELVDLRNQAVHGKPVANDAAEWVLDQGVAVINVIDRILAEGK